MRYAKQYTVTLVIETDDPAPYTGAADWRDSDGDVIGAPWDWFNAHTARIGGIDTSTLRIVAVADTTPFKPEMQEDRCAPLVALLEEMADDRVRTELRAHGVSAGDYFAAKAEEVLRAHRAGREGATDGN